MSRTTISTPDRIYTVSPDDSLPPEARFRALIVGQALDQATTLPLLVPVFVTVTEPGYVVEVKDHNWFVVAGILRSQLLKFATKPNTLHLTLSAEGYQTKALAVTIQLPQPGKQVPDLVELLAADTKMQALP